MGDVDVAAEDDLAAFRAAALDVVEELVEKAVLGRLTFVPGSSRREVGRHHDVGAEVGLHEAPFGVEFAPEARTHLAGLFAAPEGAARVALLFGGVEVRVVARNLGPRGGNVVRARPHFLHAEHVGVRREKPFEKALLVGGADAVGIDRDDAVHGEVPAKVQKSGVL